jgi:hypothetical protein
MAMTIPRDLGVTFDPTDANQLAEFEGFGTDVPSTAGLIAAVNTPPLIPTANSARAARMFKPSLVAGLLPTAPVFPTPDAIAAPDRTFGRKGRELVTINLPGVGPVDVWSFRDTITNVLTWPAPTIRLREGQLVHSELNNNHGPHTIHHHGIEPTAMNDGVGNLLEDRP